ncbi:MAG: four helix bundle protein [Bacteroidota bacterium]
MEDEKKGPLHTKSYQFAIDIVRLCQQLNAVKKEYILTKQILRSGTAIGALIREAEFASSRPDFIYKLILSLKEANETVYWLDLLFDTDYITKSQFEKLKPECLVLISMLVASIKTAKNKT